MCPACARDARAHYLHPVGYDRRRRPVLYSCLALARDRGIEDNKRHMVATFEQARTLHILPCSGWPGPRLYAAPVALSAPCVMLRAGWAACMGRLAWHAQKTGAAEPAPLRGSPCPGSEIRPFLRRPFQSTSVREESALARLGLPLVERGARARRPYS